MTRTVLRILTAILFIAAGANHFRRPAIYLRIMPPMLPYPQALVQLSGIFEIIGGIGLLVPSLRRPACWGLCLLLIAVFPANLYMAFAPQHFADLRLPPWVLWARLPFQPLLMLWVWTIGPNSKIMTDETQT